MLGCVFSVSLSRCLGVRGMDGIQRMGKRKMEKRGWGVGGGDGDGDGVERGCLCYSR